MYQERGMAIAYIRTMFGRRGEYRIRTDDPLRAKQMLWPAELIPQKFIYALDE